MDDNNKPNEEKPPVLFNIAIMGFESEGEAKAFAIMIATAASAIGKQVVALNIALPVQLRDNPPKEKPKSNFDFLNKN